MNIVIEDYLMALCNLCSDLSRYCVNCVIRNDYATPVTIQAFVNELYSGFTKINMKNDGLRKRFDGIKYDKKKIEDIIYDLSIRGLLKK